MEAKLGNESLSNPSGKTPPADYEFFGEYVLGMIESDGGSTPTKRMVQILTGEENVPGGLFKDTVNELRRLEARGVVLSANGKYYKNSDSSDTSTSQSGKSRVKIDQREPTAKEKEELRRKMQEELGDPRPPRRPRRQRSGPKTKNNPQKIPRRKKKHYR